jgi:hypothetical protein
VWQQVWVCDRQVSERVPKPTLMGEISVCTERGERYTSGNKVGSWGQDVAPNRWDWQLYLPVEEGLGGERVRVCMWMCVWCGNTHM